MELPRAPEESPFVDVKELSELVAIAGRSGVKQMSWGGFFVEFYRPLHREEPGTVDGTGLEIMLREPGLSRAAGAGSPPPGPLNTPDLLARMTQLKAKEAQIAAKERELLEQRLKQEELDELKLNNPEQYEEMLIRGDLLPDERVTVDDGKEV